MVFPTYPSSIPDRRHGYCLDDNARALMLAVEMQADGIESEAIARIGDTCAAFVDFAWNEERGTFRNFMDYRRDWLEDEVSEDSAGSRALGAWPGGSGNRRSGVKLWATGLAERVIPG